LAEVVRRSAVGGSSLLVRGFSLIALAGLVASYHGLLYSTSRQVFALGRAGHLPAFLGWAHARRQVPRAALLACSVIVAGFVIANLWFEGAIKVAVLVAGLTSLVWYVLAMGCLLALRRREPALFRAFRAPLGWLLPVLVAVLSLLALGMCAIAQRHVVPLTVALYAGGLAYYALWGRGAAVPVAASMGSGEEAPVKAERAGLLDATTTTLLLIVLGTVIWLAWGAWRAWPGGDVSVLVVLALVVLALLSLSATALRGTG
jgi:ethanolamine permease